MSLVINTNVAALVAQQNLSVSNSQMKVSVQRLSSGYRVNSAADDAAGLGRADQLRSQSRMIQASIRNINDGVSAMEIADKAAEQITNIVTRMGELAASSAQGTLDSTNRSYYSNEYNKLINEIDRISNTTEFGGYKLINGGTSVQATVTTSSGTYTATAQTTIAPNQWYIAGIRVRNNRLDGLVRLADDALHRATPLLRSTTGGAPRHRRTVARGLTKY